MFRCKESDEAFSVVCQHCRPGLIMKAGTMWLSVEYHILWYLMRLLNVGHYCTERKESITKETYDDRQEQSRFD